jgi:hypothetical protein
MPKRWLMLDGSYSLLHASNGTPQMIATESKSIWLGLA